MYVGLLLWVATRGVVTIGSLLVAVVMSSATGHVPMVLNDVLLWSLRVYPASILKKDLPDISSVDIAVFDHPSFFDHCVLMKEFGRPLRFLTRMANVSIWPLSSLARSFKCVPANFEVLKAECIAGPIFVAPDPWFTRRPFRTGAFRASKNVLPVVIHYEPKVVTSDVLEHTIIRFVSSFGRPTFYTSRIMESIGRDDETVDEYASRVQSAMDDEREKAATDLEVYRKRDRFWTSDYTGSLTLVASSAACFFIPAILGVGGSWSRTAMVAQGVASVWYHSTGNSNAYLWDTWLRNILGPSFVLFDIFVHANWYPLLFGLFAVLHFVSGVFTAAEHALLVHLPVMIGFFLHIGC